MKTVIITGSSSGIGRETVKYFSAQGWQVAATLRRPEEETALQTYPNVRLFQLDVTDQDSVTHAFTSIKATYNKIDVLINNAGYAVVGVLEAATIEDVQQQFDTNLFGVFRTIKAVLPVFRQQKTGTILNVSSLGGRMTFPLYSLYHSTKWALEGFSESLSYELEPLGIRVKIIEPGAVKTNFNGRRWFL